MATFLLHDDLVIDDQVVYVTGHAYRNCKFNRCTFYVRDLMGVFEQCAFAGCVWHLDMVIHDPEQMPALANLLQVISGSVGSGSPPADLP
jgi:hypothetical protein